jgi:hypothetical protein
MHFKQKLYLNQKKLFISCYYFFRKKPPSRKTSKTQAPIIPTNIVNNIEKIKETEIAPLEEQVVRKNSQHVYGGYNKWRWK